MARATGAPRIFRVLVAAKDLEASRRFYESLLGVRGRRVAPGRYYFSCGPVILGVLDYSGQPANELPAAAESIYLATDRLSTFERRAERLGALAPGFLHGDRSNPLGRSTVRPWGERSFYVTDPTGNSLCFVDDRTLFTGTRAQVAALSRSRRPAAPRRRARTRRPLRRTGG